MKYLILTLFLTGFFSFPLSEETFVWASQKTSESESKPSSESQASTSPESSPKLSEPHLTEAPAIRLSINIPSRKLLVFQNEKVIKEYLVAIGSPLHPTPTGTYHIERIEWNPWWYPPDEEWAKDAKVTPPGPGNPLGPVKLVMNGDLRIHGTNKPGSVGRAASHGCFRMHKEDVLDLAWFLQTQFTLKTDETLRDKYKKNPTSTYVVKMDFPIHIEMLYQPVTLTQQQLTLYPDVYWKVKKFDEKIRQVAQEAGLNPDVFDPEKLKKIKRPKEEITIPLTDLIHTLGLETQSSFLQRILFAPEEHFIATY